MIEYDDMTFTNSKERDKFLKDREERRRWAHNSFLNVNRFNHNAATMTDVGVYVCPGGGPRGVAKFYAFNEEGCLEKIKHCHLFKQEHPNWKWDTTEPEPELKQMPEEEWNIMADGLKVKLTSKNRKENPYAGMTLTEILKKNRELYGANYQTEGKTS